MDVSGHVSQPKTPFYRLLHPPISSRTTETTAKLRKPTGSREGCISFAWPALKPLSVPRVLCPDVDAVEVYGGNYSMFRYNDQGLSKKTSSLLIFLLRPGRLFERVGINGSPCPTSSTSKSSSTAYIVSVLIHKNELGNPVPAFEQPHHPPSSVQSNL
jgi:hypothetical protein